MTDDSNWREAHAWYRFCVKTRESYERRGEPLAALFYHAMRFWVKPDVLVDPENPITDVTQDEGFAEVTKYIDYKLRDLWHKYGQKPDQRSTRERNKQKRERQKRKKR